MRIKKLKKIFTKLLTNGMKYVIINTEREVKIMFRVEMLIDGTWYPYGTYTDRDKANEVGKMVAMERDCEVFIKEV